MEGPQVSVNWNYLQKKDVIEIIDEYRHQMEWGDGEQILEIGCGMGDITSTVIHPILPMNSVLVGLDVSADMIEFCRRFKMRERLRYDSADLQQPVLSVDWEPETFDKIFSFSCLHWLPDYSMPIAHIYRLLKFNGDTLLVFLTPDNPVNLAFENLKTIPRWRSFLQNVRWFYETDNPMLFIQNILREAGFVYIRYFGKMKHIQYRSWDEFMELVRSINPYINYIPDELNPEFLYEVSELLRQQRHIMEDSITGAITMEYNIIIAIAKKIS